MFQLKKSAFTLVELIIVITILAILATIAFVSFQNYVKDSRDSNRLTTMKNIETGLHAFQIKTGNYPEPEDKVDIYASGGLIGYQGTIGKDIAILLGFSTPPSDPLHQNNYTYSTNITKNRYQLFSFKESTLSYISKTHAGNNSVNPIIQGDGLGTITDVNNTPIEQIGRNIDLVNTPDIFTIYINNNLKITGSGEILRKGITGFDQKFNLSFFQSCNDIKKYGYGNTDGIYTINPENSSSGTFQVYCDMNTKGGGWTLIFNENSIGNFWDGTSLSTSFSGSTSCQGFNETCVNKSYSSVKITEGIMLDGGNNIFQNQYDSRIIFSGVQNIINKNVYEIFSSSGGQSSTNQTYWSVDGVEVVKGFENNLGLGYNKYNNGRNLFWDYGHVVYQYKRLALNDEEVIGRRGLISGHWSNGCKWPNYPCYPDHWYTSYRFWVK